VPSGTEQPDPIAAKLYHGSSGTDPSFPDFKTSNARRAAASGRPSLLGPGWLPARKTAGYLLQCQKLLAGHGAGRSIACGVKVNDAGRGAATISAPPKRNTIVAVIEAVFFQA
jgi:hypothetical protein